MSQESGSGERARDGILREETVLRQGLGSFREGRIVAQGGAIVLTPARLTFSAHGFAQRSFVRSWPLDELQEVEPSLTLGMIPNSLRLRFKDAEFHLIVTDRDAWLHAIRSAANGARAAGMSNPDPLSPYRVAAEPFAPVDSGRVAEFQQALLTFTPRVYLTQILVGINVVVFLGMVVSGVSPMSPTTDGLLHWGANYAPRIGAGQWWRLFTAMFVHIGAIHIVMNMMVLWNIGRFIERMAGNAGFLALYLFAGLTGSVASVLWSPYVVSAGASGAIFGLYGALLAFLVRGRGSMPGELLAQHQKSALVFLGYNLLFGLSQKGIDMAAHLGGLAGGFAGGLLIGHPLTIAGVAGRLRRAAFLAVLGAAALAGVVRTMPQMPDLQAILERFGDTETRLLGVFNGAVNNAKEGKIDDEQFGKVIEEQVLPEWRKSRVELDSFQRLPDAQAKLLGRVIAYMEAREEGWQLLVELTHEPADEAKLKRAREKQAEADTLAKQIGD